MNNVSDSEVNCLQDEKKRLMDAVRQSDFCATSMAAHTHCYEKTARASGKRSKDCFS